MTDRDFKPLDPPQAKTKSSGKIGNDNQTLNPQITHISSNTPPLNSNPALDSEIKISKKVGLKSLANTPGRGPDGKKIKFGEPGYVRNCGRPRGKRVIRKESMYNTETRLRRAVDIPVGGFPLFLPDADGTLRPLKWNDREIVKSLASGHTVENTAYSTGNSIAAVEACLKKAPVQAYLQRIFDKAGCTDEKLVATMAAGLNATTQREFLRKGGGGAEIIEGKERPDYTERRAAAMDIMRLKGNIAQSNLLDAAAGGVTNFNLFQTIVQARKERGLDVIDVQSEDKK